MRDEGVCGGTAHRSMAKPENRDEEAVERVMDVMLSLCSMVARASSTLCPPTAWCLRWIC